MTDQKELIDDLMEVMSESVVALRNASNIMTIQIVAMSRLLVSKGVFTQQDFDFLQQHVANHEFGSQYKSFWSDKLDEFIKKHSHVLEDNPKLLEFVKAVYGNLEDESKTTD